MYISIILFILGFILLIKGADILIDGSSSLAKKYGVSSFVIGLTIVAFGTSAPELVVNSLASFRGESEIVLGNIIGASIANILLILGISSIIYPLLVKKATVNRETPFALLAVLAVIFLANDLIIDGSPANGLTRIDGLILILFFSIFAYYTFGVIKARENIFEKIRGEILEEPREYKKSVSFIMIIAGLAGLAIGGKIIVNEAVNIASFFGLSEALIGLTIISLGTTLPELAASAVAAKKRRADIAVGNIVGSNIFNLLFILGISAIVRPLNFNHALNFDLLFLFFISILLLVLIYVGKRNILGKWEGGVLVVLYILYLSFLIYRG